MKDKNCHACNCLPLTHLVKHHVWKDNGRPSSVRQTLEPFQRWHWGNFWEMGWKAYGLFQAHKHQLELNWNVNKLSTKIVSFTTTICTKHSWPGQLGSCYCHTHTHACTHDMTPKGWGEEQRERRGGRDGGGREGERGKGGAATIWFIISEEIICCALAAERVIACSRLR